MKLIKKFLKTSTFKRFLWNTVVGFIGVCLVYVSSPEFKEIAGENSVLIVILPLVFSVLNGITKEANNKGLFTISRKKK